jgi:hypothetical protein
MAAVPAVSLLDNIQPAAAAEVQDVKLTWLEGKPTTAAVTTWGPPWPKGAVPANQSFALKSADGADVPLQSWPTAYWPDGSLKWSAHAIAVDAPAESYTLGPGTATAPAQPVTVTDEKMYVDVDTGVIKTRIRKSGPELISQIWRGDVLIARKGQLVNLKQDKIAEDEEGGAVRERYDSDITRVTVEQSGPVRAVVRVEGQHKPKKGKTLVAVLGAAVLRGRRGERADGAHVRLRPRRAEGLHRRARCAVLGGPSWSTPTRRSWCWTRCGRSGPSRTRPTLMRCRSASVRTGVVWPLPG